MIWVIVSGCFLIARGGGWTVEYKIEYMMPNRIKTNPIFPWNWNHFIHPISIIYRIARMQITHFAHLMCNFSCLLRQLLSYSISENMHAPARTLHTLQFSIWFLNQIIKVIEWIKIAH